MENLLALARNVNWGFNTKNNELFTNSAFRLYNYAQRETKLLVEITDSGDLQTVGLAFSYNARFIKY